MLWRLWETTTRVLFFMFHVFIWIEEETRSSLKLEGFFPLKLKTFSSKETKNYFTWDIINQWNSLSQDIIKANSSVVGVFTSRYKDLVTQPEVMGILQDGWVRFYGLWCAGGRTSWSWWPLPALKIMRASWHQWNQVPTTLVSHTQITAADRLHKMSLFVLMA